MGYRYYAGYSPDFVKHVISSLGLNRGTLLADPWNGAGTTTSAAMEQGIPAWGGDVNPVMAVVSKARLLGNRATPSEESLTSHIVASLRRTGSFELTADPLRTWFTPDGAANLRGLEKCIGTLLDPLAELGPPAAKNRVAVLSPLACFFYVALFVTADALIGKYRASNPTWIKRPNDERGKLTPSLNRIIELFESAVLSLRAHASATEPPATEASNGISTKNSANATPASLPARIDVANSTSIPLESGSATALVSSPPYCTRIDYAIATSVELALLGFTDSQVRDIREEMFSSSTISRALPEVNLAWGPTCASFIDAIAHHESKASTSYYLRTHLQYFDGLSKSLVEIDRILAPRSHCILVVQDSHYKELRNDLQKIVTEMGEAMGWEKVKRFNYLSTKHIGRVHSNSRGYRPRTSATESVLVFATSR